MRRTGRSPLVRRSPLVLRRGGFLTTRRKEVRRMGENPFDFFFSHQARRIASPEGGIVPYAALQILLIDVPESLESGERRTGDSSSLAAPLPRQRQTGRPTHSHPILKAQIFHENKRKGTKEEKKEGRSERRGLVFSIV